MLIKYTKKNRRYVTLVTNSYGEVEEASLRDLPHVFNEVVRNDLLKIDSKSTTELKNCLGYYFDSDEKSLIKMTWNYADSADTRGYIEHVFKSISFDEKVVYFIPEKLKNFCSELTKKVSEQSKKFLIVDWPSIYDKENLEKFLLAVYTVMPRTLRDRIIFYSEGIKLGLSQEQLPKPCTKNPDVFARRDFFLDLLTLDELDSSSLEDVIYEIDLRTSCLSMKATINSEKCKKNFKKFRHDRSVNRLSETILTCRFYCRARETLREGSTYYQLVIEELLGSKWIELITSPLSSKSDNLEAVTKLYKKLLVGLRSTDSQTVLEESYAYLSFTKFCELHFDGIVQNLGLDYISILQIVREPYLDKDSKRVEYKINSEEVFYPEDLELFRKSIVDAVNAYSSVDEVNRDLRKYSVNYYELPSLLSIEVSNFNVDLKGITTNTKELLNYLNELVKNPELAQTNDAKLNNLLEKCKTTLEAHPENSRVFQDELRNWVIGCKDTAIKLDYLGDLIPVVTKDCVQEVLHLFDSFTVKDLYRHVYVVSLNVLKDAVVMLEKESLGDEFVKSDNLTKVLQEFIEFYDKYNRIYEESKATGNSKGLLPKLIQNLLPTKKDSYNFTLLFYNYVTSEVATIKDYDIVLRFIAKIIVADPVLNYVTNKVFLISRGTDADTKLCYHNWFAALLPWIYTDADCTNPEIQLIHAPIVKRSENKDGMQSNGVFSRIKKVGKEFKEALTEGDTGELEEPRSIFTGDSRNLDLLKTCVAKAHPDNADYYRHEYLGYHKTSHEVLSDKELLGSVCTFYSRLNDYFNANYLCSERRELEWEMRQ